MINLKSKEQGFFLWGEGMDYYQGSFNNNVVFHVFKQNVYHKMLKCGKAGC